MQIRSARKNDCINIAKVQVDSNRSTYRGIMPDLYLDSLSYEQKSQSWEKRLFQDPQNEFAYVVVCDNKIVGFLCASSNRTHPHYEREIHSLYILHNYQRRGIGKKLMKKVIERYKNEEINSLILWTLHENKSKYFYEYVGGKLVEERIIDRGGKKLKSIAFCWDNLRTDFS
ncbi:GNAT family N-acetyltransferase [Vallitalea okinawensis]|uniref:GNAT family N-acetyltransferase n=1 Tax=Vallitalea okinawensis TaxID=2078660 RepID=UPI000CFB668F|nr:GNAT family N-acetyltransferase [Vallitalea okinawensis]